MTTMTPRGEEKVRSSSKSVLKVARSHIILSIHELNLYSDNPFWSSILTYSEQILSTRLFLLLISVCLLIVIIYASLTLRTHDKTLDKFSISDFERLEVLHRSTINVPCSQVSISYDKFLEFSPKFHEICSSSFLSNKWISSLFLFNSTSHNILDYRTFSFAQFRSLRLLCRTARQAIKDTHRTFNSTHLITHQTFSRDQFNEISNVLLNNLQENIIANEKRTVNIVSVMTAQNRLFSALRTNYYIQPVPGLRGYFTYNGVYLEENGTNESSPCDCRLKGNQCIYPAGAFYNWTLPNLGEAASNNPPPRFQIPGLMAGCIPLDSIRQSTLECLYNQSCVNAIALEPKISLPKALNKSLSRFKINSTIGQIFDESLFVESWQNKSSFENYYSICSPRSLSYKYQGRFHLSTIITISLSAFGGLVIACQLLTPAIIQIYNLIKRKKKIPSPSEQTSTEFSILAMAPKRINKVVTIHVNRTIHNFNLFPSDTKNDTVQERAGIIATRLYILLIFLGLIILAFYTSLSERNQTRTIDSPSLSKFEELNSLYSSTLQCPCSYFSMSHGRIMSIDAHYHEICSSEYIQADWLSYFGRVEIDLESISFITFDFRMSGQSFFDLMRILCETANETVSNSLKVFKSNRLVSLNSLSRLQFHKETQRRLKQFEKQTINSFVYLVQLIRSSIQTNQLIEEMWTNSGPKPILNNQTSKWSLHFRSRDFYTNSCSCALSNQCTRPTGFYFQKSSIYSQPNITVPGLFVGCYSIDSLLLSNLKCFYDKNCVQLVLDNYDFDVVGLVRPLNNHARHIQPLRNENSRFFPNTTISEIFSQLFVENWTNTSNFTAYYNRCAPSQCTFSVKERFDTAFMLTIMLGFYGGLSAILDIILPPLVYFIIKRWSQRKSPDPITTSNCIILDSTSDVPPKTHRCDRFRSFFSMNLFPSEPPSIDKEIEHEEIVASRIYIFLFIICLIAALLYAGPFNDERTTTIRKLPTPDEVNNLHSKNISTLSCPCSTVTIRYSKFVSIIHNYHRICSSEYISSSFINNLFQMNDSISIALSTHYRLLSSLCQSAKDMMENNEKIFRNRELISVETLTRSSFNIQINALISKFISEIPSDYRRTLSFIISSFNVNQLLNIFKSNWEVDFTDENEKNIIATYPRRFSSSNCSCALSSNCNEELREKIVSGCFPFNGFRLSKFENESLGKLNDQLFVETWTNKSNYTDYFQVCRPLSCQFTLSDKNNLQYMLITLLGLYGGLTYALHLIVGRSLVAYRYWKRDYRQN